MKKFYKLIVLGLLLTPVLLYGVNNALASAYRASEITDIQAVSKGSGTMISWRTVKGDSVIGFNVHRFDGKGFVKVNGAMVPGPYAFPAARGSQEFSFYDQKGTFGDTYRIEATEISGNRYFSRSTQSIYSAIFEEPTGASTYSGRAEDILIKNASSRYEDNSLTADPERQRWVAAQPGVKIMVTTDGLTRVTRAELANAGFDVNAPEERWQLFMDGIEHAIKIGPNGSYIEFYGKGVDKLETAKNVYFLIVGPDNGMRIGPRHIRRIGSTVTIRNFNTTFKRARKYLYFSTLLNGEEDNFFGELITGTPVSIPFDLNGLDQQSPKSELIVEFQGFTQNPHTIKVVVNGNELPNSTGNARQRWVTSFGIPTEFLQETGNTIQFQSLGTSDLSLLASISVKYKRKYSMDSGTLLFPSEHYRQTIITGVTDNQVRVFDLSVPNSPAEVSNALVTPASGGGYTITLPAARGRNLFAVEPSEILAANSIVPNTPSNLYSPANGANFLIITNPAWRNEADTWANYRASQGLQTMVVDVNDVFDEFNFGRLSASSMKTFLQHAYSVWATRPSYVLLMGDSTYDPRNYEGHGDFNFVPVFLVDTLYEETGSDDTLTDFDGDGLAEIPIGRIPARAPVDISNALQKVTTFESSIATAPARGSLCASDLPVGFDFQALCTRLHNQLPPTIPLSQVNRGDANAKTVLLGEINSGKYVVNYSGHGSTGVWASASFFGFQDVPSLTNQTNLSLFTMLTCLNGYFIRPVPDGLSESLLRTTSGGGVAVWSSTGSTTPDVQEIMATRFFNQLGSGPMNRLGNLINDAKGTIAGGRDVRLSWVLLGDPATIVKPAAPANAKAGF